MDAYANMRTSKTPVPTPPGVRLGASALVGLSIAFLWSQLGPFGAVGLGVLAAVAALAVVLAHPYRRQMKAYAETAPSVGQMIPLVVWWALAMLTPVIHLPLWGAALAGVGVMAVSFWIFPHVDGTRKLAFV